MANALNIVYLLSILGAIYGLTSEEVKKQFQECLTDFGLTKEKYDIMRKMKSPDLDCFYACIMDKRGSIVRGKVDAAAVMENLKNLNISAATRSLMNEEKIRKCVIAANTQINECLMVRDLRDCMNKP